MGRKLKDQILTMRDNSGRTCKLYINADSVRELVETGLSFEQAIQDVQDNEFQNAIARGEIGEYAWIV